MCIICISINNNQSNNNNNNQDDIYSAVIMTTGHDDSLRVYLVYLMNCITAHKRPSTPKPSHLTWAVSPPVGSYRLQPPSPFIIITQPEKLILIYRSTKGIRLSWPRTYTRYGIMQYQWRWLWKGNCRQQGDDQLQWQTIGTNQIGRYFFPGILTSLFEAKPK